MATKNYISKSKLQEFQNCPYKFQLKYILKLPENRTPYTWTATRGTDIHTKIENFYETGIKVEGNKITILENKDKDLDNFINFKKGLLERIHKKDKPKYFIPVMQEKKIFDEVNDLNGIPDAIYLHHSDDGLIVMDWKSGKIKDKNSMREEMAFYAMLINGSHEFLREVKYYGMFFTTHNHVFFEEVDDVILEVMEYKVKEMKMKILNEQFGKKQGRHCLWCGYNSIYGGKCNGK